MDELIMVMLVIAGIIGYGIWHCWRKRMEREKRRERRNKEFGTDPMQQPGNIRCRNRLEEIRIYYEETKEELPREQVDAVTWNDLDMDEVFLRVNHTRSYIGEQVLYRRLHAVGSTDGFESTTTKEQSTTIQTTPSTVKWEQNVTYFMEHSEQRQEMEETLDCIGKTREDYYLPMFLKNAQCLRIEHMWVYRLLQLTLLVSAILGIITGNQIFLGILMVTALINISIYTMSKGKYEVYLYSLGSVRQLVYFGKMLTQKEEWRERYVTEEVEQAVKALEKLSRKIGNYQGKKGGALAGDVVGVFWDYLMGATLWDITVFGRIVNLIDGKLPELFTLYEAVGEIDMEISVASFRASLPEYCVPDVIEEASLSTKGIYHPLLKDPVCNDFTPQKNCMITGANASGKSTFIKAVAVNAILAQTIHTVTAEKFVMQPMQIITSMAVRDDILCGESYYIKEVGYLKRIVEAVAVRDGMPVLCVIDEILRGTNTKERIAASEAVCHYLAKHQCLAIVATHDMELVERLAEQYESYYFTSDIRDDDIYFDYKIYEGCGRNRNAIQLLSYMKFPEEIVGMAQMLA